MQAYCSLLLSMRALQLQMEEYEKSLHYHLKVLNISESPSLELFSRLRLFGLDQVHIDICVLSSNTQQSFGKFIPNTKHGLEEYCYIAYQKDPDSPFALANVLYDSFAS